MKTGRPDYERWRSPLALAVLGGVLAALVIVAAWASADSEATGSQPSALKSQPPLQPIEADDVAPVLPPTLSDFRRELRRWQPGLAAARRFARSRDGRVSFAIVTAGSGARGYHPAETAPMASTSKVMLLLAFLSDPAVSGRALSESERSTLMAMITYSDNAAADAINAQVGEAGIEAVAAAAGLRDTTCGNLGWGLCRTSAADQARLLRGYDRLVPPRHRELALELLASISAAQRWGVATVVPAGWELRFKGGWGISDMTGGGTVHHQVAQLRRGSARIGLAILTQDNYSDAYGRETLAGVAARVLKGLPVAEPPAQEQPPGKDQAAKSA